MYKAVVTTSANPFHYGHFHVYKMAESIFGKDNVLCLIAKNSQKNSDFEQIKYHIAPYNIHYEIISDQAVAEYCKKNNINFIVRGIRNGVDAEYELKIDFINKKINNNLQTIYVPTTDTFSNISSSAIRELINMKQFEVAKEFMDINAFRRYLQKKPNYIVYCGKSCIGKSTYLKNNNIKAIDIDTFIWNIVGIVYGEDKIQEFKEKCLDLVMNDNKDAFIDLIKQHLNNNFWNTFFNELDKYKTDDNIPIFLDWASFGFYFQYINAFYLSQIKIIELVTNNKKRVSNIFSKAEKLNVMADEFMNKIKKIDALYVSPLYKDNVIEI